MKDDSAFIADLNASRSRVTRFAGIARSAGVNIWQFPEVVRPDSSERSQHADSGDLMMQVRVEHKVRDFDFMSAADFPFATIIVDEKYKIDRIPSRPFIYVIESKSGHAAAVVSSRSMAKWQTVKRYDAAQKRECEFYEAPLSAVMFCPTEDVFR